MHTVASCYKIIYKIYTKPLLKTHYKQQLSVCNNFRLQSNLRFGHVMLLKYGICNHLYQANRYTCLLFVIYNPVLL